MAVKRGRVEQNWRFHDDEDTLMLGQLLAKYGIWAVDGAGLSAVPLYLSEVNGLKI